MRPVQTLICHACREPFPAKLQIDGRVRSLYRRKFCLACSQFGAHNTSKHAPLFAPPAELVELRRKRRNQKTYRWQKKRRHRLKLELIQSRGGRCESCGYCAEPAALEFHHRDPATKEFGLANFHGRLQMLLQEMDKCDLLCANCHRLRHVEHESQLRHRREADYRWRQKLRAIEYMGGGCNACGLTGHSTLFEFHHWDAAKKAFGISESGIARRWEKIVAELVKCAMLCANCHRELHVWFRAFKAAGGVPPWEREETSSRPSVRASSATGTKRPSFA